MRVEATKVSGGFGSKAMLALGTALLLGAGIAQAATKYVADGGVQNSRGGFDLPKQGACPADATATSRPDCLARRFVAADSAACTALTPASGYSWSTGVCNDLVNTTKDACQKAVDRYWNAASGVCAIVMKGDDRNAVVCAAHGGTWVTTGACTGSWVMPARDDAAYGPGGLLTSNGAGDQCLRCHNSTTQYNGARVRDTSETLRQGHKNMSRPVSATFKPWGGPPFTCTGYPSYTTLEECVHGGGTWDPTIYPSDDSGNAFSWNTNKITVGTTAYDLKWIYGDWLAALPRAIYTGPTLANMSYSCGRCHTTGWTSDAGTTPNAKKHPESDFPGISWTGTADAATGKVKLGGGVAGDANVLSSWDQWGISCSRCHHSAVDDASAATPPYTAPTGMSSHHNNLTSPNINSGACSDARWTNEAPCTAAGATFMTACSVNPTAGVCTVAAATQTACAAVTGATWVAAASGWCSNAFYTDKASCEAAGFPTKYVWTAGWCKTADAQTACTGGTGDAAKTWRLNGSQASCQLAGATWQFTKCSVEGFCNKGACSDTKYANSVDCAAAGAYWAPIQSKSVCDNVGGQFAWASDIVSCGDAGGRWFGNNTTRGQVIMSVCMDCHRQETSGVPNTNGTCSDATKTTAGACIAAGAKWTESGGGLPMLVGPYHSTITFPSHPHSNQFMNSPHARFSGKWGEIATGKVGTAAGAKFQSGFMDHGEALNTGNGCTGCHDVHQSIPAAGEEAFREECNVCHHTTSLRYVNHSSGKGTPLEKMNSEPMEACVSCHMPGGLHLFRINPDPAYSLFPMPASMAGNVPPNTAPDGTQANAAWVDLDLACGQCHGGGTANVKTTGSITAGSAALTVASGTGFLVGEKIRVVGAGAYYYDDIGHSGKYTDFDTFVKAVSGTTVTLAGTATKSVTNSAVTQNVTTPEASYRSKADLAATAKSMHNDHPYASFTAKAGTNTMTVSVDASASKCAGKASNCESFAWTWGDATTPDAGMMATHVYAKAGTYTITLTVSQKSTGSTVATQSFTAKAVAGAPNVEGACTPNYPSWSVTCSLNVPAAGYKLVSVNYGDSGISETMANPASGNLSFSHPYREPGNYAVRVEVVNELGLTADATIGTLSQGSFIAAMPRIAGKVLGSGGEAISGAQILIASGRSLVASTLSTEDGSYSTGALKPGTYSITVSKAGYSFAAQTFTIGPSLTNQVLVGRNQ